VDCNHVFANAAQMSHHQLCSKTLFDILDAKDMQFAYQRLRDMLNLEPQPQQPQPDHDFSFVVKSNFTTTTSSSGGHWNLQVGLLRGDDGSRKFFLVRLLEEPRHVATISPSPPPLPEPTTALSSSSVEPLSTPPPHRYNSNNHDSAVGNGQAGMTATPANRVVSSSDCRSQESCAASNDASLTSLFLQCPTPSSAFITLSHAYNAGNGNVNVHDGADNDNDKLNNNKNEGDDDDEDDIDVSSLFPFDD
jgi:hypothetical protein